ncbi:ferritin family protein [Candidatus Poribacteria bacterium]
MEATFKSIIAFAIENEKEALELYERMKDLAQKQSARVMFDELAAEEVKHREFFEGLTGENVPDLPLQEVTDLKISDYLVDVSFKPDMGYQDILIMAMKREESAVKLYSDIAAEITDPKLKKLLEFMAQEEAKHKLRLETEYDENVLAED